MPTNNNASMFPILAVVRALVAMPPKQLTPTLRAALTEGEAAIMTYCRDNMVEPAVLWGDYDMRNAGR